MTTTVANPDYVVLQHATKGVMTLKGVLVASVDGGRRFDGNGYRRGEPLGKRFSFGVDAPDVVEITSRAGKKRRMTDLQKVLFCGGSSMGGAALPKLDNALLLDDDEPPFSSEIPDERQTHVLDNGASTMIADAPPFAADDLADSTDDVDLDLGRQDTILGSSAEALAANRVRGGEMSPFRDDFVDRMHKAAKAAVGPNGEVLDEFDQKFQIQTDQHEELHEQANFVRTNPVSAMSGILGNQLQISSNLFKGMDPNTNQVIGVAPTLAYWTGDDSETLPVTVHFGVASPPSTWNQARPFGIVQFGTRGFLNTVFVDIAAGTKLTVSGSQVIVRAGIDNQSGAFNNLTLPISAALSFGAPATATKPTRTIVGQTDGAGNCLITVPPFAQRFTYFLSSYAQAQNLFVEDSVLFTPLLLYQTAANAMPPITGFPIPNGCTTVQIGITAAGAGQTFTVIFELGL